MAAMLKTHRNQKAQVILRLSLPLVAVALLAFAGPALADRPGTPDQVRAEVLGPDRIRLSWFDTANRHGDAPRVVFELEPGSSDDPSTGPLTMSSYDPDQRTHWDIGSLKHGIYHCFRVWARNPGDQMRSDQPSGFGCANLPGDRSEIGGTMTPTISEPVADRTVWLRMRADRLTPQSDGFVVAIGAGADCARGWQDVMFQNGGFAGLGPAHARRATDRYWLCWSDRLHGLAPAPAPRIR